MDKETKTDKIEYALEYAFEPKHSNHQLAISYFILTGRKPVCHEKVTAYLKHVHESHEANNLDELLTHLSELPLENGLITIFDVINCYPRETSEQYTVPTTRDAIKITINKQIVRNNQAITGGERLNFQWFVTQKQEDQINLVTLFNMAKDGEIVERLKRF